MISPEVVYAAVRNAVSAIPGHANDNLELTWVVPNGELIGVTVTSINGTVVNKTVFVTHNGELRDMYNVFPVC